MNNEPETTVVGKTKVGPDGDSQPRDKELECEDVVRTLVEWIPEEILMQTTLRKKKVSFKKDAGELGVDQESREWMMHAKKSRREKLSGESEATDGDSAESENESESLCMILAEQSWGTSTERFTWIPSLECTT